MSRDPWPRPRSFPLLFVSLLPLGALRSSSPFRRHRRCLSFVQVVALISSLLLNVAHGCDIWKAADCPNPITKAEEDYMREDDYSKAELYKYCDKGKAYVDCMNARLKCCDLRTELRGALAAYDKQLEKQAWKLAPYCAGIGTSNVVKYKCRNATSAANGNNNNNNNNGRATTSTSTRSTRPTMPPCRLEKVSQRTIYIYFFSFALFCMI